MTSRTGRRSKALLLVLVVLALATAGVVYAHWTATLKVDAQVRTGAVGLRWTGAGCFEYYPWGPIPPFGWPPAHYGEVEGKDVGSTTATVVDDVLQVVVSNGYPSYAVDCEIEFTNDGTVPVIIRGWRFVPGVNGDPLENCTVKTYTGGTLVIQCDELTVALVDGVGAQIDPGDPFGAASSLRMHVEQSAEQSSTFEFGIEVCVTNWNEPATAQECFAIAHPMS